MNRLLGLLVVAPLLAPLCGGQPRLQNARLETRAVSGSLDSTFRTIANSQAAPAWIGYAAPQIAGERSMCCWNTNNNVTCQGCTLEPQTGTTAFPPSSGTVRLEGASEFYVFFRVENKQVEKVRNFSIDCNVDAGGLPFYWLTGVNPAQSIALLESLIPPSGERKLMNNAVSAIALHRDPAADTALDRLLAQTQPEETRRQAAFWLGNARGRHGYESLVRVLRDDPSDRVREHAIFALTQSKEADAVPTILRVARDDKSTRVRSQALFWLAQKATRQISEEAIQTAIDQDPETQVKKKAVFALTQMPNGDGVPLLIQIAKSNRNAVVRKEAMFWLGQSKDPRAAKFFEDVLVAR
jgi:HEAT repeat protein